MEDNGQLVAVRAAVSLPSLPLGTSALVDPADPYIAERLELGYLVRVAPPAQETADRDEVEPDEASSSVEE